jgi:hypothetical protein
MDKFKYISSIKQIDTTKTVYELEELVRKYGYEVKCYIRHDKSLDLQVMYYKLFVYALNKFTKKSKRVLPDFIYNKRTQFQIDIIKEAVNISEHNYMLTYEDLIDIFEFDTEVMVPFNFTALEELNDIVGTKPIHFKLNWIRTSLTSFNSSSLKYETSKRMALYIYGLRYKMVNFPNSKQTIIESFLDYYKPTEFELEEYKGNAKLNNILLKQQALALEELYDGKL